MIQFKQSQDATVLVRLVDFMGTPRLGVAFGSVVCTVVKADGTTSTFTPTSPQWTARNADGFFNSGCYTLIIPAAQTGVVGVLELGVSVSGCQNYVAQYLVVSEDSADVYDKLVVVEGKVDDIKVDTEYLAKVEQGRWKIFTTGPDANRLVLYDLDGTTVLKKFDLKDSSGSATTTSVFERVPV